MHLYCSLKQASSDQKEISLSKVCFSQHIWEFALPSQQQISKCQKLTLKYVFPMKPNIWQKYKVTYKWLSLLYFNYTSVLYTSLICYIFINMTKTSAYKQRYCFKWPTLWCLDFVHWNKTTKFLHVAIWHLDIGLCTGPNQMYTFYFSRCIID